MFFLMRRLIALRRLQRIQREVALRGRLHACVCAEECGSVTRGAGDVFPCLSLFSFVLLAVMQSAPFKMIRGTLLKLDP